MATTPSRYFSPGRAEQLAGSAEPIGAVRQQAMAVLLADIVGFTQLCERLPLGEVIGPLRAFHRRMAEAVFAHDGTLEKIHRRCADGDLRHGPGARDGRP